MHFVRNVARLLRNEGRALDAEVLALAFGATAIAAAVGVFNLTENLEWACIGGGIAIPVQLVAMASRPTAIGVGVVGTVLSSATVTAVGATLSHAFWGLSWSSWILGALLGVVVAGWVARAFRYAVRALTAGSDWY